MGGWASLALAAAWAAGVEFNRDVRPILSDRCVTCHGPDAAAKGLRLRLDREDSAKQYAIVAGAPEKSALLQRISSPNRALRMPPHASGLSVSEAERDVLTRWIAEGAKWEKHWSFLPPRRSGAGRSIDEFVGQRLAREGLRFSAPADAATLLRRVSLDLTGLPPTIAELDDYLREPSLAAYERAVDRMLASPRYGERMAFRWLDAARYADTNGYQTDVERVMWRWRDWVIEAFARNMPYNEFVRDQIAGDLLPGATQDQIVATGFNRNHRGNSEGGIVPEEYLVEYAVDRVETMSTVFLGLTTGCARCHNHKYDPITQKEFYQLLAFFNHIGEPGRYLKYGNSPPYVKAPTAAHTAELKRLGAERDRAWLAFHAMSRPMERGLALWRKGLGAGVRWNLTDDLREAVDLSGLQFSGKAIESGDYANVGYEDRFTLALRFTPEARDGVLFHRMNDVENYTEGLGVNLKDGQIEIHFAVRRLDDAIRVKSKERIEVGRPTHIAIRYDGTRLAQGMRLYLDGRPAELEIELDALNQDFKRPGKIYFGAGGGWEKAYRGTMQELRVYGEALAPEEMAMLAIDKPLGQLGGTAAERELLKRAFLYLNAAPEMRDLYVAARAAEKRLAAYERSIPTVMTMREPAAPPDTHVLLRGAYDKPGEKVMRDTPAALPPFPEDAPRNRLGLARWLTDAEHPLTARVAVNRFWQMLFGTGLVKTTEDFGAQGEFPVHAELLDFLAVEFVESGWDVKRLLKQIVMSETYRQSSAVTPQLLERDPANRLLARGPRVRLPAEGIRDQALFVSGLLTEKVGGPSVKPYQPAGLWSENGGADYVRGKGEELYRRSLYTFFRRTAPPPFFANFDSALREACTVRESRTNTPLQALHLLNDVQFLEAARALAQRVMGEAAEAERLTYLFRVVLARGPREAERRAMTELLAAARDRFLTDTKAAAALLEQGDSPRDVKIPAAEHATWMLAASQVLNLDAALTKE
jgi:hypothetical protein